MAVLTAAKLADDAATTADDEIENFSFYTQHINNSDYFDGDFDIDDYRTVDKPTQKNVFTTLYTQSAGNVVRKDGKLLDAIASKTADYNTLNDLATDDVATTDNAFVVYYAKAPFNSNLTSFPIFLAADATTYAVKEPGIKVEMDVNCTGRSFNYFLYEGKSYVDVINNPVDGTRVANGTTNGDINVFELSDAGKYVLVVNTSDATKVTGTAKVTVSVVNPNGHAVGTKVVALDDFKKDADYTYGTDNKPQAVFTFSLDANDALVNDGKLNTPDENSVIKLVITLTDSSYTAPSPEAKQYGVADLALTVIERPDVANVHRGDIIKDIAYLALDGETYVSLKDKWAAAGSSMDYVELEKLDIKDITKRTIKITAALGYTVEAYYSVADKDDVKITLADAGIRNLENEADYTFTIDKNWVEKDSTVADPTEITLILIVSPVEENN